MSYTHRDSIILDYSWLVEGEVKGAELCPSCGGGVSDERSLSVGRNNGLLWWKCHRNSCQFSGGYRGEAAPSTGAGFQPKGMTYTTVPLPDDWAHYLGGMFHLPPEFLQERWAWTEQYGGRVIMPIYNEHDRRTGDNLRSYEKGVIAKALINKLPSYEGGAWYNTSLYPRHVVVVEDQPSALRVSCEPGVNAIALLGTSLSPELSKRIVTRYPGVSVTISLDQDATAQGLLTAVNTRRIIPTVKVRPLSTDIKNMSPSALSTYIGAL